VGHAAEDGGDAAAGPSHPVLDLPEGARPIGGAGQGVQQLAHEVAAAVVKEGDLAGLGHRVVRRVLGHPGARYTACGEALPFADDRGGFAAANPAAAVKAMWGRGYAVKRAG
jgi:hypothetical protein